MQIKLCMQHSAQKMEVKGVVVWWMVVVENTENMYLSRYLSVLIDSVKSAWANTNSLESGNHFNFSRGKSNISSIGNYRESGFQGKI